MNNLASFYTVAVSRFCTSVSVSDRL